jgi:hypothetical protein
MGRFNLIHSMPRNGGGLYDQHSGRKGESFVQRDKGGVGISTRPEALTLDGLVFRTQILFFRLLP